MTYNPLLHVVAAFVNGLVESGVRHVVISPGSRSTPLTMTLARTSNIRTWTILDERSAGFFALGLARASGTPVGLVCTSGTATANYHPAIMEAHQTEVPLIVITADRPPELYGVGSNQTVDQLKMYGHHVKAFFQMPVPDGYDVLDDHARSTAYRSVFKATSLPNGPVHINWPFREPLIPPQPGEDDEWHLTLAPSQSETRAPFRAYRPRLVPDDQSIEDLAKLLSHGSRGLIVCGPQESREFAETVLVLAEALKLPVLADPLSQLRSGTSSPHVITSYDVLLRDRKWFTELQPDFILRFGRTVTSKSLGQYLSHHQNVTQIVVTEGEEWHDPWFAASFVIQASPTVVCQALLGRMSEPNIEQRAWAQRWITLEQKVEESISSYIAEAADEDMSFEGRVFMELQELLDDNAILMVGNSMPIRDMDSFWTHSHHRVRVLSNRGVSGIDGVVSTAIGAAAAGAGRVTLVIGDVSFYHDLGALQIAMAHRIPLTIVLVNNHGGGIFAFLPQADYPDTFDKFQTPHGLSFKPVVEMFGGHYQRVVDWTQFATLLGHSRDLNGVHVLECFSDTNENVRMHRAIFRRVQQHLEQVQA